MEKPRVYNAFVIGRVQPKTKVEIVCKETVPRGGPLKHKKLEGSVCHNINGNTLQHYGTHCNTMRYNATQCDTMQHNATQCNTIEHTATLWNTHTATLWNTHTATLCDTMQHNATQCNTMQHNATLWNTLQHYATQCNTTKHIATLYDAPQHNFTHPKKIKVCNVRQKKAARLNAHLIKRFNALKRVDIQKIKKTTSSNNYNKLHHTS